MPPLVQNIFVFVIVALCVAYVGWQAYRTLRGKRSRVGSCCATGCAKPPEPSQPSKDRIVYLPVDMLKRTPKG